MESRDTKSTRFIAVCIDVITSKDEHGFTLIELLVTTVLGLMLVSMILTSFISNRDLYRSDLNRTKLNENLRGAMDIIGADARLSGENFGKTFPAVELTNGSGSSPDTLFLRRNLLAEVLPVCTAVASGSTADLSFAIPGTVAGCTYSGQTTAYNSWRNYRLNNGGSVRAFIWDTAAKAGEFFQYTGETNGGNFYSITRAGGWTRNYPTATSAVYIIEEWKFSLDSSANTLELYQDGYTTNPKNISFDIEDFQVLVNMQDGTSKTVFTSSDPWSSIKSLEVTLRSSDTFKSRNVSRSLTSNFFPRNVLSN